MVDDDDGDGFPSSEPRTDSKSALPRKIRAWRRLRIVKRDESFSLMFSPRTWIYGVGVEVGGGPGGSRGAGGAPYTLVDRLWAPLRWFFCQYFLFIPKLISVKFQVIWSCAEYVAWRSFFRSRCPAAGILPLCVNLAYMREKALEYSKKSLLCIKTI